jgi:hypothetical protein
MAFSCAISCDGGILATVSKTGTEPGPNRDQNRNQEGSRRLDRTVLRTYAQKWNNGQAQAAIKVIRHDTDGEVDRAL